MDTIDGYFERFFERSMDYYRGWIGDLTDEPESVITATKKRFTDLAPALAYADERDHPMAFSLFTCASLLCLFLELRERDVTVHAFGARMLRALSDATRAHRASRAQKADNQPDLEALRGRVERLKTEGSRSQQARKPGQFIFDVRWDDETSGAWTMDMTACGICHLYGQHDALDLVPYMCATDDVMSDMNDEGLRRTGTIALGRSKCDFRYQPGVPTQHLSQAFPERIRIVED